MSIAQLIQRALPPYAVATPWQRPSPPWPSTEPHFDEMPDKELPYYGGYIDIGINDLPSEWQKSFIFTKGANDNHDQIVILRGRHGKSVVEFVEIQYRMDQFLINEFFRIAGPHTYFCDAVVDIDYHGSFEESLADIARGKGELPVAIAKQKALRRAMEGTKQHIEDLAQQLVAVLVANHGREIKRIK